MLKYLIVIASLLSVQMSFAQMPKNDSKQFEYRGETTVKRAGTGDLMKRIENWANTYFKDAVSYTIAIDDTTNRYIEIDVKESMVESHFGVNRMHKSRFLSYHIKFDAERKTYNYVINDFHYQALEIDNKNRETQHDAMLSDIKSAATISMEEEIHSKMEAMIEDFSKALEIELAE